MNGNRDYTFCELREKEVINMVDGRRLGHIVDMAFTSSGQVFGLMVPGNRKMFRGFGVNDRIFIPWRNICKIGNDVILIELLGQVSTMGIDTPSQPTE